MLCFIHMCVLEAELFIPSGKLICSSLANARVSGRNRTITIMGNSLKQHPPSRASCTWAERWENNTLWGVLYLLYCSWQTNVYLFNEAAEESFAFHSPLMTASELQYSVCCRFVLLWQTPGMSFPHWRIHDSAVQKLHGYWSAPLWKVPWFLLCTVKEASKSWMWRI